MIGRAGHEGESLHRLAQKIGARIVGDGAVRVIRGAPLGEARSGEISFVSDRRYLTQLETTQASAVVLREPVEGVRAVQLIHPRPQLAFAEILRCLHPEQTPADGVHETASLGRDVQLAEDVRIGAHAVLEDGVHVGSGTWIGPLAFIGRRSWIGAQGRTPPGVVILHDVEVGDRVILHPGVVLGGDGYGFAWDGARHRKIPQVGRVVLEDDVELGACTTVDRATLGETRIGSGTKSDDHVHIAHNVRIGRDCLLVAQVGISGSAVLGDRVTLAGQVGVAGHIRIGDGTVVTGKAGVNRSVGEDQVLSGYPVIPHARWLRAANAFSRLPDLLARVRELEHRLDRLKGELAGDS